MVDDDDRTYGAGRMIKVGDSEREAHLLWGSEARLPQLGNGGHKRLEMRGRHTASSLYILPRSRWLRPQCNIAPMTLRRVRSKPSQGHCNVRRLGSRDIAIVGLNTTARKHPKCALRTAMWHVRSNTQQCMYVRTVSQARLAVWFFLRHHGSL